MSEKSHQFTKAKFQHGIRQARYRGFEWFIGLDDYTVILNKGCYYCSRPINNIPGVGLDRKNNRKGYLLQNVVPCCPPCNQIRGDHLSVEEMKEAMQAVIKLRLKNLKLYNKRQHKPMALNGGSEPTAKREECMMSHSDGFVAAIFIGSKPQREMTEDGKKTVRVPFGTEYSLRLKNKTNLRAYVRVEIDGMDALSGSKLILQPYSHLDLERFLEGNDNQGRRFKFVSADSSGVTDPTSPENGLVRVIFEPERPTYHTFTVNSGILRGAGFSPGSFNGGAGGSAIGTAGYLGATTGSIFQCNAGGDVGATEGGSVSNQQFVTTNTTFVTGNPVTLDIWMKGSAPASITVFKAYRINSSSAGTLVSHCGHTLGEIEAVELTATHAVIKIPLGHVSFT